MHEAMNAQCASEATQLKRIQKGCGGRESNPHALAGRGFSYPLRLSPPRPHVVFGVWTISLPTAAVQALFRVADAFGRVIVRVTHLPESLHLPVYRDTLSTG